MISKVVLLCILLFTMLGSPYSQMLSSITQHGVTFQFDQAYQTGQYANGDYWVLGPVTITAISPDFTGNRNGWEVNPKSFRQHGFDDRLPDFTPSLIPSLPYTSTSSLESIVKVISRPETNEQPKLKTAVILTIVSSIPQDNGSSMFRPPYFGTNWKPNLSTDQIESQGLPSFAPVENTPSLSDHANDFSRVQLDHRTDWRGREFHPIDNMPAYGASVSIHTATGALRLMLNDPIENKMQGLINYIQNGIDLYAVAINGGVWYSSGGHGSARKLPITFAAVLLQDIDMQMNIASWAESRSKFQEDQDYYFSQHADNGNGQILYGQPGNSEFHYWRSIIQQTGSKTARDPYEYIDGGRKPGESYQFCCTSMTNKGIAMSLLLMPELQCVWNNDQFIEYTDRWVSFGAWGQNDPCAPPDLADTDMSNYGITYGPDGNGGCIVDTDPSDGIGRFPATHGTNANQGNYQNEFANKLWDTYRSGLQSNTCNSISACAEDDYIGLRNLYLTTNGNNWTNNTGWPDANFFMNNPVLPTGIDISTWTGVTLNDAGCLVQLSLFNNNLSGSIPPELGNLTKLTHLSLSINNLTGPIPSTLGNLLNLTTLNLSNNELTGSIPWQIGELPNLIEMVIHDNNLSGCYPASLKNLCNQLTSLNNNLHISDFNNFDASWEDFCNTNAGNCEIDPISDLIAHWPMDESGGPIVHELVASKHGTPSANVVYGPQAGQIAGALQFNGTNTRVECPSINVEGDEMTITFWMKANDFINVEGRMISKAESTSSSAHYWMVSQILGSGLRFRLRTSSGGTKTLATATGMIPQNEWIFVTAKYDGQEMKLYKNAVEIASVVKTGTITSGDVPVCIGNQPSGAGERPFSGQLDDLKIFDRALPDTEITDMYNSICAQYLLISDMTLTEDMSFIASEQIELQNVNVPEAYTISITSKNLVVGMDCNLNGQSNLIISDDINCQ